MKAKNTLGERTRNIKHPQFWPAFSCISALSYAFSDNFAWLLLRQSWPAVKQKVIACSVSEWIFKADRVAGGDPHKICKKVLLTNPETKPDMKCDWNLA